MRVFLQTKQDATSNGHPSLFPYKSLLFPHQKRQHKKCSTSTQKREIPSFYSIATKSSSVSHRPLIEVWAEIRKKWPHSQIKPHKIPRTNQLQNTKSLTPHPHISKPPPALTFLTILTTQTSIIAHNLVISTKHKSLMQQ